MYAQCLGITLSTYILLTLRSKAPRSKWSFDLMKSRDSLTSIAVSFLKLFFSQGWRAYDKNTCSRVIQRV